MKMFILKVCSLLVLAAGVWLVAFGLQLTPLTSAVYSAYTQAIGQMPLNPELVYLIAGVVLGVFGLVGFAPSPAGRSKRRAVVIPTEYGQASVQLDAVAKVLTRILKRMPEVRKARVVAKPSKDRSRAVIDAFVTLRQEPDAAARQTVNLITEHITEAAIQILGLEDLAEVRLHVDNVKVDTKKAARSIAEKRPVLEQKLAGRDALIAAAPAVAALTEAPIESPEIEDVAPMLHELEPAPVDEEAPLAEAEPEEYLSDGTAEQDGDDESDDESDAADEEDVDTAPQTGSDDDVVAPLPPLEDDALQAAATTESFETDNDFGLPPLNDDAPASAESTESDVNALFGSSTQDPEAEESGAEDASWMEGPAQETHAHDHLVEEREAFWRGDADPDPYHSEAAEIGETAFAVLDHEESEAEEDDEETVEEESLLTQDAEERGLERMDLMAAVEESDEDTAAVALEEDDTEASGLGLEALEAEAEAAAPSLVDPGFAARNESAPEEPKTEIKRWGFF
ncbi:MAG: hypothetical protein GC168_15850 [Candidatus Hydrogenedens sp.]|nr:hypothetical protein [Candidatus Hydrogenedens sp.]